MLIGHTTVAVKHLLFWCCIRREICFYFQNIILMESIYIVDDTFILWHFNNLNDEDIKSGSFFRKVVNNLERSKL